MRRVLAKEEEGQGGGGVHVAGGVEAMYWMLLGGQASGKVEIFAP